MASITKRQNKWRVQIRKQGYRYFSKTFFNKDNAIRWSRKIEYEMDAGQYTLHNGEDFTLVELLTKYMNEITILKKSRIQETYCIQKLLRENFCSNPMYKLTMSQIQSFKHRRANSPVALRHELIVIRHCLKIARSEWGLHLKETPFEQIFLPKPPKSRKRRLSNDEYQKLYQAAKTMKVDYIWPIVSLALETGMRRGEILKLKWSNINFDDRVAYLEDTKNGEDRYVPLSIKVIKLLSSIKQSNNLVFPVSSNAVRLSWERLKRKANVRNLRFHDLRHEALSRFTEKGLNPIEVSEISGHKQLNQLKLYNHISIQHLVKKI